MKTFIKEHLSHLLTALYHVENQELIDQNMLFIRGSQRSAIYNDLAHVIGRLEKMDSDKAAEVLAIINSLDN